MEKLMTVAEVADYLRLNREVVLRKARKGELPAVKVGTKTYRFYKGQLDKWLESKSIVITKADKEQQLLALKKAKELRAKIERRVGEPLPSSAEEIRALRGERARRAF
jgi:excisionase family DNA binding protein